MVMFHSFFLNVYLVFTSPHDSSPIPGFVRRCRAWVRRHGGGAIGIGQALEGSQHRQGQGDEQSEEQNAVQIEDLLAVQPVLIVYL